MKYHYTILQAPADYGQKDELQKFLNEINATDGEITQVIQLENRYMLIIYRS